MSFSLTLSFHSLSDLILLQLVLGIMQYSLMVAINIAVNERVVDIDEHSRDLTNYCNI